MAVSAKKIAAEPVLEEKKSRGLKGVFRRSFLGIPYALFLAMFVIFPLLLIVFYAFTDKNGAFTFGNFIAFFSFRYEHQQPADLRGHRLHHHGGVPAHRVSRGVYPLAL